MLYYCTVCIWIQDKINLLVQQIMCELNFADHRKQVQGLTSDKGWRVKHWHCTRLTIPCHKILSRRVRNSQAAIWLQPGIMGADSLTHSRIKNWPGQRYPWRKNGNISNNIPWNAASISLLWLMRMLNISCQIETISLIPWLYCWNWVLHWNQYHR